MGASSVVAAGVSSVWIISGVTVSSSAAGSTSVELTVAALSSVALAAVLSAAVLSVVLSVAEPAAVLSAEVAAELCADAACDVERLEEPSGFSPAFLLDRPSAEMVSAFELSDGLLMLAAAFWAVASLPESDPASACWLCASTQMGRAAAITRRSKQTPPNLI